MHCSTGGACWTWILSEVKKMLRDTKKKADGNSNEVTDTACFCSLCFSNNTRLTRRDEGATHYSGHARNLVLVVIGKGPQGKGVVVGKRLGFFFGFDRDDGLFFRSHR